MPLAIQEDLLAGTTPLEKLQQAASLGFEGVELYVTPDLPEQLAAILEAVETTGIRVSAVNLGHTRLIHPDFSVRDTALVAVRRAMTLAIDLGAQGVIFKPFYEAGPVLPDLHPYKSAQELEAELLVTQLRATLCDLAYALGTELLLQPASYRETHLVRKVEHGALIRRKLDNHPHLKIAASLHNMELEAESPEATFQAFGEDIGYLYVSDTGHTLPGQGQLNFAALNDWLDKANYQGWLTLDCDRSTTINADQIAASVACLREAKTSSN